MKWGSVLLSFLPSLGGPFIPHFVNKTIILCVYTISLYIYIYIYVLLINEKTEIEIK
jgi:hypothetical protein